jgi:alcohol dehydrogenase
MRARSLLLTGPRTLTWVASEIPPPAPGEVLIRTHAGAVSIGSELPLYRGVARTSAPVTYPRMTGYESLGTVLALGANVQKLRIGDRAVGFYGHRTAAVIPESKAIRVPETVSDRLALLAILSCDAAKGVQRMRPWLDEPVLITGLGVIGALTLFLLRAVGNRIVDVIEPRPERRALALELGARQVLSPGESGSQDASYAVGFECSSRDAALLLLQQRMRPGGRICVLADGNLERLTLAPAFHEKELSILGSSDGWDYQAHAAWFFERVMAGPTQLEALFGYETTAERLPATFELLANGSIAPLKILVHYADDREQTR